MLSFKYCQFFNLAKQNLFFYRDCSHLTEFDYSKWLINSILPKKLSNDKDSFQNANKEKARINTGDLPIEFFIKKSGIMRSHIFFRNENSNVKRIIKPSFKRRIETKRKTNNDIECLQKNTILFNYNKSDINCEFSEDYFLEPIIPKLNQSQKIEDSIQLIKDWYTNLDIRKLHLFIKPTFNLTPYISSSFTLKYLFHLNVDLSKVQLVPGVSEFLIKVDFHQQINPILCKLSDFGFNLNDKARIITVSPNILKLSLDELDSRLRYFTDRNVLKTELVDMLIRYPRILEMKSIDVDRKLGEIKDLLQLKNNDLRKLVVTKPKLIVHPLAEIKDIYVIVTKMMGFEYEVAQSLFLLNPKILVTERKQLTENFRIMHIKLDLPLRLIKLWPNALTTFPFVLSNRTDFLLKRGLFQPDPLKPLYTPLDEIGSLEDDEFCTKMAQTTVEKFDKFIRTL